MRTDRPVRPGAKPDFARATQSDGDLLYGRNAVWEALRGRRRPRRLLIAEGVKEDTRLRDILSHAKRANIPVDAVPRPELDLRLDGANHQGIALLASTYPYAELDAIAERPGNVLLLDHLQDVQNVGTLLRAAEAAAVAGVVIPRDRGVAITPATVNASSGAVEHLAIAQETNLVRVIERLQASGRWAVGLDTDPNAIDIFADALPLPAILVVGSEGAGLTPIVKKHCDLIAEIPMAGKVASLNAATAGSIALFELVRRSRST